MKKLDKIIIVVYFIIATISIFALCAFIYLLQNLYKWL